MSRSSESTARYSAIDLRTLEGTVLTKHMIENIVRSTYLARVREDADAAAAAFTDQAFLQVSAATIPASENR
jgi:hypothetical protein